MKIASKLKWKAVGVYGKLKGIPDVYAARVLLRSYIQDYKSRAYSIRKIMSIHEKGFTVSDWAFLELDHHDYKKYLSNVDYYRMHPLNGPYGYIIDSKLALKEHCFDTPINQYMPEYYFRITGDGELRAMFECPNPEDVKPTWHQITELLKEKGILAVKRNSGSIGEGFYKCEYTEGYYYANETKLNDPDSFFSTLRDYLITEYLKPHPAIAKICPDTANAIRYLVGRIEGKLVFIKGYIRFGTRNSGFVENYNAGGVLCYLDKNGFFNEGNVIDPNAKKNRVIHHHPDTGAELKGQIPCWDKIQSAVEQFGDQFPQLDYLGFDFVVKPEGSVVILEINSLTSLDGLQLNGSILETDAAEFYKSRMR